MLEIQKSPFGAVPILDEEMYAQWTKTIAGGAWIGKDAFFFDSLQAASEFPRRPVSLTGDSLLAARLVQVALGVLTVEIAFRLGELAAHRADDSQKGSIDGLQSALASIHHPVGQHAVCSFQKSWESALGPISRGHAGIIGSQK